MSKAGDRLRGRGYRGQIPRCSGTVPCLPSPLGCYVFRIVCRLSPVACSLLCLCFALGLDAKDRGSAASTEPEQFFIISSVDASKQQLVLKRPTEVTLLVGVNGKTAYSDEQGKPLQLKDFRAGDTVYVALHPRAEGPPLITRIRKGLMTPEELRRRYLKAAPL